MVCLALSALPCQALDIGRAEVNSRVGEPLDARVRIRLDPGERIDNSCLSVGDQDDFPESDHVLIRDVQLSLLTPQNAIRISTSKPLDLPAVSIALRVRCADGLLNVRALNLYLNPRKSHVSTSIVSSLPGSSITVQPGDSVYGFARMIFPGNEIAVRKLALAIAAANPVLFPDGRPRPLQIGERLTIPDFRTVQRIAADSGIAPTSAILPAPQTATSQRAVSRSGKSQTAMSQAAMSQTAAQSGPSAAITAGNRARPDSVQNKKIARSAAGAQRLVARRTGKLNLILALSIGLAPSKGMTEAGRAILRQELRPAVAIKSNQSSIPGSTGLSLRVAQIREAQDGINAQITRLSSKVAELHEFIAVRNRAVRAPPATMQAASPTGVPTTAAASPIGVPLSTAAARQSTPSWWQQSPWWKWPASAALVLLVAAGFVFVRKFQTRPSIVSDKERISNILEKARVAATPLLESETVLRSGNENQFTPGEKKESFEQEAARTVIDLPIHVPAVGAASSSTSTSPYPDLIDPSTAGLVTQNLKREMAVALDGARSMFTDVDRFILLGRSDNAISMLEFQIKKHPEDRDAWVKLLAVYEQEGMDDEFHRTQVAFGDQFKGG